MLSRSSSSHLAYFHPSGLSAACPHLRAHSSAGKTQFALAFTVRAALLPPPAGWPSDAPLGAGLSASVSSSAAPLQVAPPLASHAIYLSSEGHLPTSRLISLLPPSHADRPEHVLSRIHFLAANDAEAVDHVLSYLVPSLLARLRAAREPGAVRLLVLDSLAAVLRSSFGQDRQALAKRSEAIGLIADKLKSLGVRHGFAVIVLNQVADVFGPNPWLVRSPAFGSPSYGSPANSQGGPVSSSPAASQQNPPDLSQVVRAGEEGDQSTLPFGVAAASYVPSPSMAYRDQTRYFSGSSATSTKEAALGLVWANAVSTRVMLRRTERFLPIAVRGLASGQAEEGEGDRLRLRQMTTVFSAAAEAGRSESYLVQTSRVVSVRTIKGLDGPPEETSVAKRPRPTDDKGGDNEGDAKRRAATIASEAERERAKAARRAAILGLLPGSSFVPASSSAASERGMT
jgi:hypothetical protein